MNDKTGASQGKPANPGTAQSSNANASTKPDDGMTDAQRVHAEKSKNQAAGKGFRTDAQVEAGEGDENTAPQASDQIGNKGTGAESNNAG